MRTVCRLVSVVVCALCLLGTSGSAPAAQVTFVIDPDQSELVYTGRIFAGNLTVTNTFQLSGSLTGQLDLLADESGGYTPGKLRGFDGLLDAGDLHFHMNLGFLGSADYYEDGLQLQPQLPAGGLLPEDNKVGGATYNPAGSQATFFSSDKRAVGFGPVGALLAPALEILPNPYSLPVEIGDERIAVTVDSSPLGPEVALAWNVQIVRSFNLIDHSLPGAQDEATGGTFSINGRIVAHSVAVVVPEPTCWLLAVQGLAAAMLLWTRMRGRRA